MLLTEADHAAFDAGWLEAWEDLKAGAASGGKSVTAADIESMLISAIENTNLPPKMKGTMAWRIQQELYGELGLTKASIIIKAKPIP